MTSRTHIPALSRDSLIVALQRIDLLAIDPAAKHQLKAMLTAAANPDTNKIETIIETLPKARQEEIFRIFDEVARMQQAQADNGSKIVIIGGLLSLAALLLAYLLTTDQEALTAAQLFEMNKRTWINAVQDEIDYCGCNARARSASGSDLETLQKMAVDDAKSIVGTYNKDAQRQLEKLFTEFPKGDKQFFISSMQTWAAQRATWKSLQVALNTETQVREYARSRFRQENFVETTRYKFVGPTPICKLCVTQFAAGFVDLAHIEAFPCPRHLNCPHQWQAVRKPKVDCAVLWVG